MTSLPFIGATALLTLVVLAWLSYPLLKTSTTRNRILRRSLNAAIYRDQLLELERDRDVGNLAEADYAQARDELQHRLLQDTDTAEEATSGPAMPARRSALVLALLLPASVVGLYLWLGTPAALELPGTRHEVSAKQINDMVAKLAARMAQNPDDLTGWTMLARSYKALRHFEEAEKAYANVIRLGGDKDPNLLADYADLLAARTGQIEGKPLELVQRALEIDPEHTMALALAGSAAYTREDFAAAAGYWERLLKLLPADSDDARALTSALAEVRSKRDTARDMASTPAAKLTPDAGQP